MEGGSSDPPHRQDRLSERDLADSASTSSAPAPVTTLFSSLPPPLNDCRFTLFLIRTPPSLYQYACNHMGGIRGTEMLINTLANSHFCLRELLDSVSEILVYLARSPRGRRLVVYCFTNVHPSHTRALCFKMYQYCLQLATDRSGLILVTECIPLMEETQRRRMLYIIWQNAHFLAQHCHGTHVVQRVVSAEYPIFTERIVMEITPLFLALSTQQEGSYLVEKCISSCLTRKIAVKALVELQPAELVEIACNEFGNFVIQKALLTTKNSDHFLEPHSMLRSAPLPLLKDLIGHRYGRNAASKLWNRRR